MDSSLTIVIPVKNRAAIVGATLDSVARQSLRPLRLIIVDNGSTDGTAESVSRWMSAHPDIDARLLTEPTPGAAAARNCGLAAVETPWVMFFDSDDTMEPDHVARVARTIAEHPDIDMVGWDVRFRSSDGRDMGRRRFYRRDMVYHTIFHGSLATQRWAARTSLVREVGGWDAEVKRWNDIELGLRLLGRHPRVEVLRGEPMVDVLQHPQSITSDHFYYDDRRIELSISRMERTVAAWPDARRQLRRLAVLRAIVAGLYGREGRADQSRALLEATAAMGHAPGWLLKAVSAYTARGGRGVARLLQPFL